MKMGPTEILYGDAWLSTISNATILVFIFWVYQVMNLFAEVLTRPDQKEGGKAGAAMLIMGFFNILNVFAPLILLKPLGSVSYMPEPIDDYLLVTFQAGYPGRINSAWMGMVASGLIALTIYCIVNVNLEE